MDRHLKKRYFSLLLPSAAGFALLYLSKMTDFLPTPVLRLHALVPSITFILAALFAVALPILYRSYFAHNHRHRIRVSARELTNLESRTIALVMAAPYLALFAYAVNLPRFHLCGIILMALYAVYYFYPSRKRLNQQKRIYRIAT